MLRCTGNNFSREYLAALFSGYGGVVFLDIVLIFWHFSSSLVSATSYADDIAHT